VAITFAPSFARSVAFGVVARLSLYFESAPALEKENDFSRNE